MKTRSCHVLGLAAVVLASACSDSPPTRPILGPVSTADVEGTWHIAFRLDSALLPTTVGSLVISDRFDTLYSTYLTAELRADFTPLLGRQVTCLANPQASLVQPRDSGVVHLWFTPGAADCGLFAVGWFDGREFHGDWSEPSFSSQPLSSGTFRMWRQR
jgi:hypothetical protein